MEIERINSYYDERFSKKVLLQHGCFLVDRNSPYEVEIISDFEAVIRGEDRSLYPEIIERFRFYAPQVIKFFDTDGQLVAEFPQAQLLAVRLD